MGPDYYVPSAPQRQGINKKIIFIAAGVLVAIFIGVGLLMSSSGSGPAEESARAVARQEQLIAISADGEKNIRSGDLRKINADANLFFKTDSVALTNLMKKLGPQEVPQALKDSEKAKTNIKNLTDAVAAGRYDETFAGMLKGKLEEQQALLRAIHDGTNSQSAKTTLQSIYAKNETLLKQLQDLES
jgi:hypothetical protein